MFKKILIGFAAIVAILVIVIATRPDTFRVERSTIISGDPSLVFAQANDLHQFEVWSPWAKLDPNMKTTHEGAPQGTGAMYSWVGNKQVGEGRMTITESKPNEKVLMKLEFFKPFEATSTAEFTFQPQGNQTKVTWAMHGECNFMSKAMGLFCNMDKMIGGDFEKGLSQMKAKIEQPAPQS